MITELLAEFLFLNLWLPQNEIMNELRLKNFNIDEFIIDEFIASYKNVKKSTILQWITLICPFACHFGWVVTPKDESGNLYLPKIYDQCRYGPKLELFPFDAILRNPDSISAKALAIKESRSGKSTVDGNEYRCYAYYEKDLLRSQSNDYFPDLNCERYDQLLVIGWDTSEFQQ